MLGINPVLAWKNDLFSCVNTAIRSLCIDFRNDGIGEHGRRSGIGKSLLSSEINDIDFRLVSFGGEGRSRVGGGSVFIRDWKRYFVGSHWRSRSRLGGGLIVRLLSGPNIALIVATRGLRVRVGYGQ